MKNYLILFLTLKFLSRFKIKVSYDVSLLATITAWGSGALIGEILLLRIIENNKIDAYFRSG